MNAAMEVRAGMPYNKDAWNKQRSFGGSGPVMLPAYRRRLEDNPTTINATHKLINVG
jgi:hypothetical protein